MREYFKVVHKTAICSNSLKNILCTDACRHINNGRKSRPKDVLFFVGIMLQLFVGMRRRLKVWTKRIYSVAVTWSACSISFFAHSRFLASISASPSLLHSSLHSWNRSESTLFLKLFQKEGSRSIDFFFWKVFWIQLNVIVEEQTFAASASSRSHIEVFSSRTGRWKNATGILYCIRWNDNQSVSMKEMSFFIS